MESILKKYFGFSTFRPYQREIVEKIVDGRDCLVVMSTGSGKSLCYQLPPLITKKTAVVISPLISLMQDQVMALKERGIKTEHLSSAQNAKTVQTLAEKGHYDILYMTPEKACLLSPSFWSKMQETGICLLAVDEAHCISEWGQSFRVEYKRLDKLRDVLMNVPVIGLTATATGKVRVDIMNSLKMSNPHVTVGSFDRHNLFYGVKSVQNHSQPVVDDLVEELTKYAQSGCSSIVYCTTVKDAEEVFTSLLKAGVKSGIYHGQMSNGEREKSHRSFIRDEYYVMVATIAFGMGIDKPDIRYVIHYGCPKSLESYYQESGRCGRDGVASVCWLYFTRSDFAKGDFYSREAKSEDHKAAILESFGAAQSYCFLTSCRRKFLLEYFGQNYAPDRCENCDNCTSAKEEIDRAREAFLLIGCVRSCGGRWGLNMPIDVLRGSQSKKLINAGLDKLPFHGMGKEMTANWWKSLGDQLISNGYLMQKYESLYRSVSASPKGLKFVSSCRPDYQPPLYLPITSEMTGDEENKETGGTAATGVEGMSEAEEQLYKLLLDKRMQLARNSGTAPYAICGDETLRRMVLTRPSTKARLANIDGVNQHLMQVHGDHFLNTIQQLSKELDISLDRDPDTLPPPVSSQAVRVPRKTNLPPAKFEAWKMWQEDGLTMQNIANHPRRSAPIKEQTVGEYLLEAAREGCTINWLRFCEEIGLTQAVYQSIQNAVAKVGKEKMKPIKNELPREVNYFQIKTCLTIQELGLSSAIYLSNHEDNYKKDGNENGLLMEDDNLAESNVQGTSTEEDVELSENPSVARKRQKVEEVKATESAIIDRVEKSASGVSLSDLVEHFNGSTEESLLELLANLEGEFVIFRKNGMYMIM